MNENGILSKGKRYLDFSEELVVHPDTGSQIEGVEIPNWNLLTEYLVSAHKRFPYYLFFAWDVVIDQNGTPHILEVNKGSDLEFQAVKPLRNERMGEFMKAYEMLSKRIG